MNPRLLFGVVVWIVLLNHQIYEANAVSPYNILDISRTATDKEIQTKYRALRSKNRRNRIKKHMMKQAYTQIMMERKFNGLPQNEEATQFVPPTIQMPQHIDQTYVYGYKLRDEYDDGSYFKDHFNETQHIIERMQNSEENKKTAKILVFFGSLILKILPCVIIFCLCRKRGRGQASFSDAMARAGSGYANFGRRLRSR